MAPWYLGLEAMDYEEAPRRPGLWERILCRIGRHRWFSRTPACEPCAPTPVRVVPLPGMIRLSEAVRASQLSMEEVGDALRLPRDPYAGALFWDQGTYAFTVANGAKVETYQPVVARLLAEARLGDIYRLPGDGRMVRITSWHEDPDDRIRHVYSGPVKVGMVQPVAIRQGNRLLDVD